MRVYKIAKNITLAAAILSLAACSSTDYSDVTSVNGLYKNHGQAGGSGVQTAGIGRVQTFPGANTGKIDPATGERGNTIYFGFDQSSIDGNYMEIIEANAAYLRDHPNAKVRLEGHTDPRGSREYNIGLGQRRGGSVNDQLAILGITEDQMDVVSYGKEKLAVPGNSDEDYRLDRRVEIVYENAG